MSDRAWRDYTERFRRDVLPHLLDSAVMLHISPDIHGTADVDLRQATELGLMLLLDKPILVVVPSGRTVPAALERAAAEVVRDWDPDARESQDRMAAALRRLVGEGNDG